MPMSGSSFILGQLSRSSVEYTPYCDGPSLDEDLLFRPAPQAIVNRAGHIHGSLVTSFIQSVIQ